MGWAVALIMILLAVLIAVTVWPLRRAAAPRDTMAQPFGDWPHIDPRL